MVVSYEKQMTYIYLQGCPNRRKIMKVYQQTAQEINLINTSNTPDHVKMARERLDTILKEAPSGAGIDNGTRLDDINSTSKKLIFHANFHHMNDAGYYEGWTEHMVIVTPCLMHGFNLQITGKDRNQIKDYLHEVYQNWLNSEV
jgi:thiaminase